MLYDTHCHPYLSKEKTQEEVLNNFSQSGVFLNCIGVDIETSYKSVELASEYSFIYATIGIHPCDIIDDINGKLEFLDIENTLLKLENLLLQNKKNVVGIGETGFDFHWLNSMAEKMLKSQLNDEIFNNLREDKKEKHISSVESQIKTYQEIFFKAHILLADKYSLPVIIHNRNSKEDVLRVLKEMNFKNFIFHCYSEDYTYAQQLIEFSPECKISFSGIVTFKSAKEIQETAANIPLKNILVETDAPYLTPTPHRGKQENEPAFVQYVLEKIIELRDESAEIIEETIFQNSLDTFGIKHTQ